MTCPCSDNQDLKAVVERIQGAKARYPQILETESLPDLLLAIQDIHEVQNGIDKAKVHFNKLKNDASHSYDSWSAAAKDFDRMEKDVRRLYYDKKLPKA